jgi:hypothetical protein
MKNDFHGHDNRHINNLYCYIRSPGVDVTAGFLPGHEGRHFVNNTVVMTGSNSELIGKNTSGDCKQPANPNRLAAVVYGNHIYTPDGKAQECGRPAPQSPGTMVNIWPTDEELLKMAKERLLMG